MNCEDIVQLLPDISTGSIDPTMRFALEKHLEGCAGCREAVETWNKLGVLADEQPDPALGARFDAMLAAYQAGSAARPRLGLSGWIGSWWPNRPAFQFGLALAFLSVGVLGGYWTAARRAGVGELAELRQEVRDTRRLVAVSLLQQQSASNRLRGVNYSYRMAQADEEVLAALLYAVRYDTSVDVRLGAVDALRRYVTMPGVRDGLLEALGGPQSPLVQIALIDLMVDTRQRESIEALKRIRDDEATDQAVRKRAAWGLQQL